MWIMIISSTSGGGLFSAAAPAHNCSLPPEEMPMTGFREYGSHDALGLAELVKKREIKPEELLDEAIQRTEQVAEINAVVLNHYERARDQIRSGLPDGPFKGVPFLIKDFTALKGTPTTYGSNFFVGAIADHDSTLVERYLNSGLVIYGKTNTPEFGLTLTTEPRLYGPCRNPWDLEHSTGGSSGGSAAAVAARIVPIAHATDGGGSIRVPSAACGVFGLKPTRARTPLGPLRGENWSGLGRAHAVSITVRDSAALLDATAGPAPGDPYHAPLPQRPFLEEVTRDPGKLRVSFTDKCPDGSPCDTEVAVAVRHTARLLEKLGHMVQERAPAVDPSLPNALRTIIAASTDFMLKQHATAIGRDCTENDVEHITWLTALSARHMTATDYAAALATVHRIGRQLASFFTDCDVFLAPTLCLPPLKLGELDMMTDDINTYLKKIFAYGPGTSMFNMSGQPSMSVPLAWSKSGLPLGMMFTAPFGDEATLFRLAGQLEKERPWRNKIPPTHA
jgi:amidase